MKPLTSALSLFMVLLVMVYVTGCGCFQEEEPRFLAPPEEPPPKACGAVETITTAQSYPSQGVIKIERMEPDVVPLNKEFDYQIKVTNLTDSALQNVVVTSTIPENLKLLHSRPQMRMQPGKQAQWQLGTLGGNEERLINIRAMAIYRGTISSCTEVSYDKLICSAINVVEPRLALKVEAPDETHLCDEIPLKFTITNTGTADICQLVISHSLSSGMTTIEGLDELRFEMESLKPGESEEFNTTVKVERTGEYVFQAVGVAQDGVRVESKPEILVIRQPALKIRATAPAMRYIGNEILYEVEVTNTGDWIARDLVVEGMITGDSKLIRASDRGAMEAGKLVWKLNSLGPNQTRKLSAAFMAQSPGEHLVNFTARAHCADEAETDSPVRTMVAGIPGILIEVVDLADPIPVGKNETYLITVTNQGSAPATNLRISCELDPSMRYISSDGVSKGTSRENMVYFEPVDSLPPKAKATWRVIVEATAEADARFTVSMSSDQLTRSVKETEATNFYE